MVGKTRKRQKKEPARPPLTSDKIFNRKEAATAAGVSIPTLVRAYDSGNLQAYRVGRRVLHLGAHLLNWLEAGGKTSRAEGGAQ